MKKIYFILIFSLLTLSVQAQTTLKYSGSGTTSLFSIPYKIGGIGDMNVATAPEQVSSHAGLFGQSTNATSQNIGVLGTTIQNTIGTAFTYIGVAGNNLSNAISSANSSVYGGYFLSRNLGSGATTNGVYASASGVNNTSTVMGVDAVAYNTSNTTPNKTIAVRGITTSGSSTTANFLKDLANPGGYFSSNDGQGIYATTNGSYNNLGVFSYSQAVTGYSNVANIDFNLGVVGYAEGSGSYKYGVYGYIGGSAGLSNSAGIYGKDAIGGNSTYAGFFEGKLKVTGSILTQGSFSASGISSSLNISATGAISSNTLAGTGTRNVLADASGNLIANNTLQINSYSAYQITSTDNSDFNRLVQFDGLRDGYGVSGFNTTFTLPLNFPNGVTLTEETVNFLDNSSTSSIAFVLYKKNHSTGTSSSIDTYFAINVFTASFQSTLRTLNETIDNDTYSYFLDMYPLTQTGSGFDFWRGTLMKIRSIKIKYKN